MQRQGIQLQEGQILTFYSDDADDQGQPDELRVEGMVHYDEDEQCWVATIDWSAIRHASEEESQDTKQRNVADPPLSGESHLPKRCS